MTESNFELIYKSIKDAVTSAMYGKKYGEVVVPMDVINNYVSDSWREAALVKLRKELNSEFGVTNVNYRDEDAAKSIKAAIVIS